VVPERGGSAGGAAPAPRHGADGATAQPVLPAFGGACLSSLVPALLAQLDGVSAPPAWLPEPLHGVRRVVLLVLDGLGFEQLVQHRRDAPLLASLAGGAITSVAPTTTATALTSIVTGLTPAQHGIVGYRLLSTEGVLNVLRWSTAGADARRTVPPRSLQSHPAFLGREVPVVSRAEFAGSGFSDAHLAGSRLHGWRVPSSIGVEVSALLAAGERLVYAYYDGVDKVAHDRGLGEHYRAEVAFADRLVEGLLERLPPGAVLAVTADHGQVEVTAPPIELGPEEQSHVEGFSGEGRFRWLHARAGHAEELAALCRERFGDVAWVRSRREMIEEDWFGGPLAAGVAARLGDVALVARAPVAFFDPADTGELRLIARHGSLTSAEMLVPLLAAAR
jgi:predicted AlkP superfamily pyrophosphatase or phosphodiesterase